MDPRRSVTAPSPHRRAYGPLVLAVLASGCAEVPKTLPAATVSPIVAEDIVARPPLPVLHRVSFPRVTWTDCEHRRLHRTQTVRACVAAAPPTTDAPVRKAPSAISQAPVLVHAVYVPDPTPLRYARPAAPTAATSLPLSAVPRDHMDGAIKVYAYEPGRVFAVSAVPLRVTTLSLEPGETLVDKAAGDTVRWEIGETTSGVGATVRSLVMLKPLTAGLVTNLVLTTSRRVYLLDLTSRSKHPDAAIAWSYPDAASAPGPVAPAPAAARLIEPTTMGAVSADYAIQPVGARPSWTPQAVFDDGRRTFIAFSPGLDRMPAPLLFVREAGREPSLVNYRQLGDLFVLDRLFDRAELRLGADHPQVVRIVHTAKGAQS